MKQYNVYGIGNALVDIEYEVSVDHLSSLGVDKGVMTLVDEKQQAGVIESMDGKESNRGSGGSAANTIIAISQFGGNAFYSCRVADDEMGHFYVDDLIHAGVTTNIHPARMGQGVTGKCLVFVTPDADRTMNTFLGVSADLSPENVDESAIEDSDYLYIEGYLVSGDSTKAAALYAIDQARKTGVKVALSLSDPNMVSFFKPGMLEMIGSGVDLLFANEEEAKGMADTDDFEDALEYLKTITKEFVVTLGSKGAVAYDGVSVINIEAVATKAVDTVGAGDMFAGAYLYGLTHNMNHRQAGELASRASAKLVASLGPRLPAEEAQKILQALNV
jgi:sugar/nucleoside kinase (ribokinase family)